MKAEVYCVKKKKGSLQLENSMSVCPPKFNAKNLLYFSDIKR